MEGTNQAILPKQLTSRTPLPTGLGREFDDFISALGVLEADAIKRGLKGFDTLTAIRKIVKDRSVPAQESIVLDWDRILPDAAGVKVPGEWATDKRLAEAVGIIRKTQKIRIGHRRVDTGHLLAALEARLRNSRVTPPDQRLQLGTSLELATFQGTLAHSVFAYMQKGPAKGGQDWKPEEAVLDQYFSQVSGPDKLGAFADALNILYKTEQSLAMNLLAYYTDPKGAQQSFTAFARGIGLGKLEKGMFENNTPEYRTNQVKKIQAASLMFALDNNRKDEVEKMLNEGENNSLYRAYTLSVTNVMSRFVDRLAVQVDMEFKVPTILSWNRLEPRARTNDFRRVLRAEIRDALWMLSRQWQMGEFAAEDAGTCVEMRVDMGTTRLGKYSLQKRPAQSFDNSQPLETIVERERVEPDLGLRLEMGKHWLRILKAKLVADPAPIPSADIAAILKAFKTAVSLHFNLPVPAGNHPDIYSDPSMLQWYAAIGSGRAIDGHVLYRALKSGTAAASYLSGATVAVTTLVNAAAAEFISWFERIYSQPSTSAETAWNASHLEYQFHCSAPDNATSTTVLSADEYASGHLDWYNFDIETRSSSYHATLPGGYATDMVNRRVITLLPGDVQFPGMPHARWWKFEDYKVDLGGIKADTTEPAKLLLAEFALLYSNDWMLLPFGIDVGSICSVQSIIVKDVFGQHTRVQAAGAGSATDWQRWAMYNLTRRNFTGTAADTRLFIPPATVKVMESEPLESVNFLRDEMANLVWGIETIVPDGRGGGREGWNAARQLFDYLQRITVPPPAAPVAPNNAAVEYQLGTSVPEHWIPFIPVRIGSVTSREIQLRRAAMPRIIPGRPTERIRPRTALLRQGYDPVTNAWSAYHVYEEEVLRSGCIVERTWQRTRWTDGTVITWLGRRKYTGKGEADSGLEFDLMKDRE